MRTGALLIVLGLLTASGCNGPGPDDEECTAQGGVCLLASDQVACAEQLTTATNVCPTNYQCCTPAVDAGSPSGSGSGSGTATPLADSGATKG